MRRRRIFAAWVWVIVVVALAAADRPAPPKVIIRLPEPSFQKPVVAGAAVVPARVQPGQSFTFVVKAKTAANWHIYAADRPTEGSIPTTLKLKLPKGLSLQGDWTYPDPSPNPQGEGWIYAGDLTFFCTLKLDSSVAAGPVQIPCEFGYQACDATSCRPPAKLKLTAKTDLSPSR